MRKINGQFAAVPIWAIDLVAKKGTPTHMHVLTIIVRLTPFEGQPHMTVEDIATTSGLSISTVKRAVRWLESTQIVTSKVLPANRGKSIIVNYRKPKRGVMGDPPTHKGGVMGDPSGGSWVTPLRGCEQGKHDSIDSTIDIVQREMSKDISLCGLRPQNKQGGTMPTFGADPDNDSPWDDTPRLAKLTQGISDVVSNFDFVSRRVGATPTPIGDRPSFRAQIKRMMNAGVTPEAFKKMTDEFFTLSRNVESPAPWKVFCSREVQNSMMSKMSSISETNETLSWVANDFDHAGDLPWDDDTNEKIKRIIWRRGMDVAYRYPELLVSIVEVSFDDIPKFDTLIQSASFILANNATMLDDDMVPVRTILLDAGVTIPKEVLSRKALRELAPSLKQAVITYQLNRRTT